MNLLLHHLRKDLRFARWMILITLVLAAGVLWFPSVPLEERTEPIKWLYLSRYGIWLLVLLTAGHLIQLDAPLCESGFMRTRPAPRSTVLLSKMIAVLILIVPLAMIECLLLVLLDLKPGASDLFLVFSENLLMLAMIGSVSMALAIREQSAAKFNASVVGWIGVGVIGWIAFTWCKSAYSRTEKPEWSYTLEYLKISRLLMAQIVSLTGALVGIVLFARSGRRETITRSLAITALCALASLFFWPLNFVKAFAPPHRAAPRNEWPDQAKLKFAFEADRNYQSIITFNGDGGYNDVTYRPIYGNGRLTGLTDGWRPSFDTSYESELTLSNGRTLSSHREAWARLGPQVIVPMLGIPGPYGTDDKQSSGFELAEFKLQDAVGAMTGAHLKGTMKIPLKRPVVLARIPFRQGASIQLGNQRIDLAKIETHPDEITYTIVQQKPLIHLRGAWHGDGEVVDFIVIHAGRKEFLYKGSASSRNTTSGHYAIELKDFTEPIWRQDFNKHPIPPDWIAGAELLVIGDENGGSFSQSFDFPNIKLSNER